ncbi:EAL domain-containing protein [Geminocystis herdmanii]|uniref:EAL domain-containing protein n=1 Tax=Geminocystis herdmanii TaxID=669359 RepID=UPI00034ABD55|nr:EAL domain-containing protein [Geminocystis herdmanii]
MINQESDIDNQFLNRSLTTGECIFTEGDKGDFAYIIEEGEVEISTVTPENKRLILNVLKSGDMFGELALVDGSARSASAYAKTNVILTVVTGEQVKSRIESADPILKLLLMVVMNYFRSETGRLRAKSEPDFSSLDKTKKEYQEKIFHAIELIRLESDLRNGFKREELVPFYQAIVDLNTNSIVGFEVLLRWFSPTRGNVSPSIFIPLAESTSLIIPMGEWLLDQALSAIEQVKKETGIDIFLSINIAEKQIQSQEFLTVMKQKIDLSSVKPKQIKLEILERSLFEGEKALSLVQECREFGLPLVIDDFGTGYANLSYLKNFQFDTLKIDQCFVKDLENNVKDQIICKTLIDLSHGLEMTAVAEGIENQQQCKILSSLGCNYGQGYLFSPPVPLDRAIELMNTSITLT